MARSIQEAMQAAKMKERNQEVPPGSLQAPAPADVPGPPQDSGLVIERLLKAANPKGKGGEKLVHVTHGPSSGVRAHKPERPPRQVSVTFPQRFENPRPAPAPKPVGFVAMPAPIQTAELPRLQISAAAAFALKLATRQGSGLLSKYEHLGRALQVEGHAKTQQREVVLGLDFGTSCVKAVFGDEALTKSFAVHFSEGDGIQRYLLPSLLFQTGEAFSLDGGTHAYSDLKLSLLAEPETSVPKVRAVAFLALAIRRARGWLLTEHEAVYRQTEIFWRLTAGLPAAQHLRSPFSDLFSTVAKAAWSVSVTEGPVTESAVEKTLAAIARGDMVVDVEVAVVPEIAAQIYGFVVSNLFDRKAPNLYLMADVGAGTVDSSLFRVKPSGRGKWDFEFYTSLVEPNGASNLHRFRSRWWSDALAACGAPQSLRIDLEGVRLQTDIGTRIPESFEEYFSGIQVRPFTKEQSPDKEFFERAAVQVQGRTFWRAWKDQLLPQNSLTNVPFFLCGGGGRMHFYQQLEEELRVVRGCSWLKAEPYAMAVPGELEAPGMAKTDFDRLSVAYGLSRLEVGKVVQALPMPKIELLPTGNWRENYVDKDAC